MDNDILFYFTFILFYSSLHCLVFFVVFDFFGNFVSPGWRLGEGSPFRASRQD
jgi:hypothetical protein